MEREKDRQRRDLEGKRLERKGRRRRKRLGETD